MSGSRIISHAVWLNYVFSLSLRDVELLLAESGVVLPYGTVRRWCRKFGQSFADRLRHGRPQPGDKWYLDEGFIRIQGMQHYLWHAMDQDGVVLDILVQERRDGTAAKRFFKRLLKGLHWALPQFWCRQRGAHSAHRRAFDAAVGQSLQSIAIEVRICIQ